METSSPSLRNGKTAAVPGLDGPEARPGLPEPALNPKGNGGSEAFTGGSAAGPLRAAAPVGAGMGRGARWRQGDPCSCPGETMLAGNPGGGEEQCVPKNDF